MKTSIKTLTTICAVVISLSATAQHRSRGNEPQPQNNSQNNKHTYANNHHGGPNWGGPHINVTIGGGYPNYGGGYYYYGNSYGNHYSLKKAARNSIRQSAQVIGQALQFSDWNDMYSPWLAKAIRHQQYAKQLYFWGDYAGALNHAERAGFLAWNTLSYFNNAYGYDDGFAGSNYPNPYTDPNNPYYRQSNPSGSGNVTPNGNTNTSDDSDFGYRKSNPDAKPNEKISSNPNAERKVTKEEIDNTLPQNKMSDKELLKTSVKDLDIE